MRQIVCAASLVLALSMAGHAQVHGQTDNTVEEQIQTIERAIVKAIPDKSQPLRTYLAKFEASMDLRKRAAQTLRQHIKDEGMEAVRNEIRKGVTPDQLREVNRKLRHGIKTEKLGFPWCLLWGCK